MNESNSVPEPRIQVVVITGLSGSGKSTVAKCFEDLGYYCVDNLPLPLMREFLAEPERLTAGHQKLAIVADVRVPGFAGEFPAIYREIDRTRIQPTLLFLESSDETLLRRFSETRRPHPLRQDISIQEAIDQERDSLAELRGLADMVFDTSQWTVHEMRSTIYRTFGSDRLAETKMRLSLVSFGFKYGIPLGSDLLFDIRFLPNPHFVEGLRPLSGRDEPVLTYLLDQSDFRELEDRLTDLLKYLLPRYRQENRSYLSLAIGCTGGKHRSVALVERLAARLADAGWEPTVRHRDVER